MDALDRLNNQFLSLDSLVKAAICVHEHGLTGDERVLGDLLWMAENKAGKGQKLLTALHIAHIKETGQPLPDHLREPEGGA